MCAPHVTARAVSNDTFRYSTVPTLAFRIFCSVNYGRENGYLEYAISDLYAIRYTTPGCMWSTHRDAPATSLAEFQVELFEFDYTFLSEKYLSFAVFRIMFYATKILITPLDRTHLEQVSGRVIGGSTRIHC